MSATPSGHPVGAARATALEGAYDNFGPWHEHVLSWARHRDAHPSTTAFARYEDMLDDTVATLNEAMSALRVELSQASLRGRRMPTP